MDFPLSELMDEQVCDQRLVGLPHPGGLKCPRCGSGNEFVVHRRHRDPVLDFRCGGCGRVFNAWTGTSLHKTHRRPSELLLILRGISQGRTTAGWARELACARGHLLAFRHQIQTRGLAPPWGALADPHLEADEMYQNAGEKRPSAHRSTRSTAPPRQQDQGPWHVGQRSPPGVGRGG